MAKEKNGPGGRSFPPRPAKYLGMRNRINIEETDEKEEKKAATPSAAPHKQSTAKNVVADTPKEAHSVLPDPVDTVDTSSSVQQEPIKEASQKTDVTSTSTHSSEKTNVKKPATKKPTYNMNELVQEIVAEKAQKRTVYRQMSIYMEPELMDAFNRYVKKHHIGRSPIVAKLIQRLLAEVEE